MKWINAKPLDVIRFDQEPSHSIADWRAAMHELLTSGARPVAMFTQKQPDGGHRVWTALTLPATNTLCLTNAVFPLFEKQSYPSLSNEFPSLNYFECELYEQTGIEPEGHPWLRPFAWARLAPSRRALFLLPRRGPGSPRNRCRSRPCRRDRARTFPLPMSRRGNSPSRNSTRLPTSRHRKSPAAAKAGPTARAR